LTGLANFRVVGNRKLSTDHAAMSWFVVPAQTVDATLAWSLPGYVVSAGQKIPLERPRIVKSPSTSKVLGPVCTIFVGEM
jgi:hypothetical protein